MFHFTGQKCPGTSFGGPELESRAGRQWAGLVGRMGWGWPTSLGRWVAVLAQGSRPCRDRLLCQRLPDSYLLLIVFEGAVGHVSLLRILSSILSEDQARGEAFSLPLPVLVWGLAMGASWRYYGSLPRASEVACGRVVFSTLFGHSLCHSPCIYIFQPSVPEAPRPSPPDISDDFLKTLFITFV